jgi:hypothetical protein
MGHVPVASRQAKIRLTTWCNWYDIIRSVDDSERLDRFTASPPAPPVLYEAPRISELGGLESLTHGLHGHHPHKVFSPSSDFASHSHGRLHNFS